DNGAVVGRYRVAELVQELDHWHGRERQPRRGRGRGLRQDRQLGAGRRIDRKYAAYPATQTTGTGGQLVVGSRRLNPPIREPDRPIARRGADVKSRGSLERTSA